MRIQAFIEPERIRHVFLNFTGWPDAGGMIEATIEELHEAVPFKPAAVWDLEGFWHIEATRPQIHIQHGQIKKLDWPRYQFHVGTLPSGESILVGTGPEPSCRWRTFVQDLLGQLREWGCSEVFLLGSLFDQIFHDEVLISCVVQDARGYNQVHELGCQRIEYEGPSAIHAAIMEAAPDLGIRCLAFWVHLPFYLKGPHELLMAHLLRIIGKTIGIEPDTSRLMEQWQERQSRIESLIQQDQELRQTLEFLRQQDRPRRASPYPASKVVRLEEFLKKRSDPDPEAG